MVTRLQQEIKDRHRARAERLRAESQAMAEAASGELAGIPPGQPILVGHHSEARHRATLRRHDRKMRKALDLDDKARAAESTADHAGKAVLGRDPEALDALRQKITAMEKRRDQMKAINKAYRRGGWERVALVEGVSETLVREGKRTLQLCEWEKAPFPPYALRNLGANIRRVRERIEEIESRLEAGDREIEFEGGRYEEDAEDDRIRLYFDRRLSKDEYRWMRSRGFRFSRENQAFQRHLNNSGRYAARTAVRHLFDVTLEL